MLNVRFIEHRRKNEFEPEKNRTFFSKKKKKIDERHL